MPSRVSEITQLQGHFKDGCFSPSTSSKRGVLATIDLVLGSKEQAIS